MKRTTKNINRHAFLENIRMAEFSHVEEFISRYVTSGARLLEIGAGTGWQAREFTARGYLVDAIDIPTSNHGNARIWPVIDYDGIKIPFDDESFDIVYSSNVLEHVVFQTDLNSEIQRVLRSDGIAVHYVPTSAWRMWSLIAFYPALIKDFLQRVKYQFWSFEVTQTESNDIQKTRSDAREHGLFRKIIRRVIPRAHGAHGTVFNEIVRFRKSSWDRFFLNGGWSILHYGLNGIFLTGDMLVGEGISIKTRRLMSHILGNTAHLYVLKKHRSGVFC